MPKAETKVEVLEGFSFTCNQVDADKIYALLKTNGFEENSDGLKKFLIAFHDGLEPEMDDEDEIEEDRISKVIRVTLETAAQNPELAEALKKKGGHALASLLKKMAR